jgi:hypothetical protein
MEKPPAEDLPDDDEESVERAGRVAALADDDSLELDDGAD